MGPFPYTVKSIPPHSVPSFQGRVSQFSVDSSWEMGCPRLSFNSIIKSSLSFVVRRSMRMYTAYAEQQVASFMAIFCIMFLLTDFTLLALFSFMSPSANSRISAGSSVPYVIQLYLYESRTLPILTMLNLVDL